MDWLEYLLTAVRLALAVTAFFGKRWAYAAFIVLGLSYFPISVGFQFDPKPCEWTFGLGLAVWSLTNVAHIVMFGLFFLMTLAQFRYDLNRRSFLWSLFAVVAMGLAVEFGEGLTGQHNCRMRDVIPNIAGGLIAASLVYAAAQLPRKDQVAG